MRRFMSARGIVLDSAPGDDEQLAENTIDHLAVSYYATKISAEGPSVLERDGWSISGDLDNRYLERNEWGWQVDPLGLRIALNRYHDRYPNLPILIAENGIGARDQIEGDCQVRDPYRVAYHRAHIEAVRESVADGCNVMGYLAWSGIDVVSASSNERSKRYGFIYVDLDDHGVGSGRRIRKDSFDWYRTAVSSHGRAL